ncbi:MAG: FAD-dependent thymidylate synthase [Cellulosilyticum sp.]|nr:FAD-dependent thymidylate synthase [Cellulosilyticum sp.]
MRIIKPSVSIESNISYEEALRIVENATRVCYKSEDKIKEGSAEKLIKGVIKAKHLGCIEHVSLTVKFICDRACSHQLVRHRLMSFNQKSQRYCKEDNLEVIKPDGLKNTAIWLESCRQAENAYAELIRRGEKPEVARGVLPNSTATEIYATANLREWRHFFELRCDRTAQKDIRMLALELLCQMFEQYPVFFEDMVDKYAIMD